MNENAFFAICINNAGYPVALELHKIYRVIAVEDDELQVIDESGEGYWFSTERFMLKAAVLEIAT